jgi:hypothetical protein
VFAFVQFSPSLDLRTILGSPADADTAAEERSRARLEQIRIKWYSDLHAAGAHGPAGIQPPMLWIRDLGSMVYVQNVADITLDCVRLSRGAVRLRARWGECARLEPGRETEFTMNVINADAQKAPLVYEVGDPLQPEPSWWSDPALQREFGAFDLERSDVR